MRTRYDQFGKQMARTALETYDPVETDAEVTADTRRIDLWFMPDPARQSVPEHLGVLGRIASGPSTLEFFHNTPSGEELAACLIKHGEFRHFLSLRRTPPPVPTQWVISSGRPDRGIEGLWLRPMSSWPPGIYEGPPLLWTRLVVVNELPGRSTASSSVRRPDAPRVPGEPQGLLRCGSVVRTVFNEHGRWTAQPARSPCS